MERLGSNTIATRMHAPVGGRPAATPCTPPRELPGATWEAGVGYELEIKFDWEVCRATAMVRDCRDLSGIYIQAIPMSERLFLPEQCIAGIALSWRTGGCAASGRPSASVAWKDMEVEWGERWTYE